MKNLIKDVWFFIVFCFESFIIVKDEIKKDREIRKSHQ